MVSYYLIGPVLIIQHACIDTKTKSKYCAHCFEATNFEVNDNDTSAREKNPIRQPLFTERARRGQPQN